MYKSYKLVVFMVNVNGGESETVEHLYKEVEGASVPMTKSEAVLKMLKEVSSIGGNPAIQSIRAILFDLTGDMIKIEEVTKDIVTE